MTDSLNCLRCKKRIRSKRGQCVSCHSKSGAEVRDRKTTWEQMIADGVALPSRQEIGKNKQRGQWM